MNYFCKTDIDEAMVISFSGYGQTDTISESTYEYMPAHKKFQLKAQNQELAVDRYMYPRMAWNA